MLFRSVLAGLVGCLALEAAASPISPSKTWKRNVPSSHILHERHRPHWGRHWSKRDKLDSEMILPMRIGLQQSNLEAGHTKLMDISNPASENYGKHMTAEEVIDFFAPRQSSVDIVREWLVSAGIAADRIGHSVNKQWIQFDATVAEAEDLLITEFFKWEHSSGSQDISCEEYHVPAHIQDHIDYVTPGTRLRTRRMKRELPTPALKQRAKKLGVLSKPRPDITQLLAFPKPNSTTCQKYVIAECTRVQYDLPFGITAVEGNELGIFEGLDDHYSRESLDVYFSTLYNYIPNGTYPEERLIDGAVGAVEDPHPSGITIPPGLESALDFDSAWPLIWPQNTVLFQEDDEFYEAGGSNGFWNTFLDAIDGSYCTYRAYGETGDCTESDCQDPVYPDPYASWGYQGQLQCGVYKPTNVISISYGGDEPSWPDFYVRRQCDEWMKLVLQGTTIVTSSGDYGVGASGYCAGSNDRIFVPNSASTCPYVLSVGSTEFDRYSNVTPPTPWEKLKEVATTRFPSGGGFSNVFPMPDYQQDAVNAYLNNTKLPFSGYTQFVANGDFSNVTSGVFHIGGRAYPDVAAIGDRQVVYTKNSWWLVGGTSLSAPTWGAVVTLINELRILAGRPTVGFLHPTLYAHPEIFNDITEGSNPGCNSTGFVATGGWDPVSGLGSPNFPLLLSVLTGLEF